MLTIEFERLDLRPGNRILDIGCGSGRHTAAAAAYPGITAIGVDRCLPDVREARSRLIDHEALGLCRGLWRTLVADIGALPFPDAYFDLVICAEVLEHLPDDQAAIAEIARELRPSRGTILSAPGPTISLQTRMHRRQRMQPSGRGPRSISNASASCRIFSD